MAQCDAGSGSRPPHQWRPRGSLLEQNDEWAVSRRYMPVEKLTGVCNHTNAATMIAAQ
jgi:hypothetical protein